MKTNFESHFYISHFSLEVVAGDSELTVLCLPAILSWARSDNKEWFVHDSLGVGTVFQNTDIFSLNTF